MKRPSEPGQFARTQTLQPGELAQLCRVDPHTIGAWAREGKLPSLRTLGGHRRYLRRDLDFLPQDGDPQLLTYAEMAQLMAVTAKTVGQWALKGKLSAVILPGQYPRVIRSEVMTLLAGDSG